MGKIGCLLGRHPFEYVIGHADLVIRWCPRCQNLKAADVFQAKRLPGVVQPLNNSVAPDRPIVDLDPDAIRAAAGMMQAIAKADDRGFNILAKHADPVNLTLSLCFLVADALAEHSGLDLGAYADRVFERLGSQS
jgi:hypothetical protein